MIIGCWWKLLGVVVVIGEPIDDMVPNEVDIGVDMAGVLSIMFIFRAINVAVKSFGPVSLAFLINDGCAFNRASSCCCFIAASFSCSDMVFFEVALESPEATFVVGVEIDNEPKSSLVEEAPRIAPNVTCCDIFSPLTSLIDLSLFVCSCSILSSIVRMTLMYDWN